MMKGRVAQIEDEARGRRRRNVRMRRGELEVGA
jgi:hypothetical protein